MSVRQFLTELCPQLREAFCAENDSGSDTLDDSWLKVMSWIENHSDSGGILASQGFFTQRRVQDTESEEFQNIKKSKAYDQDWRIFLCFRHGLPSDLRVWDLLTHLPEDGMSKKFWRCSFFMALRRERKKAGKRGLLTLRPTVFERLMFLCASRAIYFYTRKDVASGESSKKGKKRRKLEKKALPSFGWSAECGQCLGYAVQTICRSWDVYVQLLGFKDVEAMTSPYILYNSDSQQYVAIEKREDGYAPSSQLTTLSKGMKATTDISACDQSASSRSDSADSKLRHLTETFLGDLRSVVLDDVLYSNGLQLQALLKFSRTNETTGLSPRFNDMPREVDGLEERELLQLSPVKRPSRSSVRQRVTTALTTSSNVMKPRPRDEEEDAAVGMGPGSSDTSEQQDPVLCRNGPNCECQAARLRLQKALPKYVRMYDCSFEELFETDSLSAAEGGTEESVQLLLTDPPFNHRRESGRSNSDHDFIDEDAMGKAVNAAGMWVAQGGHIVKFCSPLQFSSWYEQYNAMPDKPFNIDPHPILALNAPGHYFGRVHKMTTALFPVTSWALHATKKGLSNEESFSLVDYRNHSFVGSGHPAWTNAITGVTRLQPGEYLRSKAGTETKSFRMRPEQKSQALLLELISRFSKPGALVMDMFAGTFSTAIACLSLPNHRKFVGCEIRDDVFLEARDRVIEQFADCIVDKYSDVEAESEAQIRDAELVVSHAIHRVRADKDWNPPPGFPGFQTLPAYAVEYIAAYWGKLDMVRDVGKRPVSSWPSTLKGAVQCTPVECLAALEASRCGVCVKESSIRHPMAGKGVFATRKLPKGSTIGYYYGALVYDNLRSREQVTKYYGENGVLGVTVPDFDTWAMQIPLHDSGVTVGDTTVKDVYVVPKASCVFGMVNDYHYRVGDEDRAQALASPETARKPSVQFVSVTASKLVHIYNHETMYVEALRDILPGEELLVDYHEY